MEIDTTFTSIFSYKDFTQQDNVVVQPANIFISLKKTIEVFKTSITKSNSIAISFIELLEKNNLKELEDDFFSLVKKNIDQTKYYHDIYMPLYLALYNVYKQFQYRYLQKSITVKNMKSISSAKFIQRVKKGNFSKSSLLQQFKIDHPDKSPEMLIHVLNIKAAETSKQVYISIRIFLGKISHRKINKFLKYFKFGTLNQVPKEIKIHS